MERNGMGGSLSKPCDRPVVLSVCPFVVSFASAPPPVVRLVAQGLNLAGSDRPSLVSSQLQRP